MSRWRPLSSLLSKKLAVLVNNLDIDDKLKNAIFTGYSEKLKDFFDKYEFISLKNRIFKSSIKPVVKPEITDKKQQLGLF